MIIAQWLFSALVKPLETPGAIYSPAHDRARCDLLGARPRLFARQGSGRGAAEGRGPCYVGPSLPPGGTKRSAWSSPSLPAEGALRSVRPLPSREGFRSPSLRVAARKSLARAIPPLTGRVFGGGQTTGEDLTALTRKRSV